MPFPYTNPNESQLQQRRKIFLGADKFQAFGTATLTRGGKGNISWNIAASQTVQFDCSLPTPIENYESANVNYKLSTAFNGAMSLNSATAIYLASAVNLVAATLGVSQSTFGAAATPTVVDLLAPANLALPFGANIQEVQLLPTNNGILVVNPSEILTEVILQTPAGGTAKFYGVILEVMLSR